MCVDEWFLALGKAGDASTLIRVNNRLAAGGLSLSDDDMQFLVERRAEALSEIGRVEFGDSAIVAIAEAFAQSPVLMQDDLARSLAELLSFFYALRDELPIDVPDAEIIEALRGCFDDRGDVDAVCSMPAEEVMQHSEEYVQAAAVQRNGEFRITDDEGRAYTFNTADWEYEEYANGWEGERWSDDFDD